MKFIKHRLGFTRAAFKMPLPASRNQIVIGALALWAACGQPGVAAVPEKGLSLPASQWEPGSDWQNVKTFGAKGDGQADDTDAIQQVLDRTDDRKERAEFYHRRVVYFPAGRYRITRKLTVASSHGTLLIGCGRNTVLVWDGPDDGTMLVSNGVTYSRYEGITWDGRGKAAVGMEHASRIYYETSIRYEDCGFLNLKRHGVLIGLHQGLATAETWFNNCLFRNCGAGVSFLTWNDYDNAFDRCEFEDCGIGVNSDKGNFYIRGCHFARSHTVDVQQLSPSHAGSIRLCTSQGSRRFFQTGVGAHQSMKIQDCRVEGWTAPDGAILLGRRGPTTVFDCVFTSPPNNTAPIRLANPAETQQLLLVSNNQSLDTQSVVAKGPNSRITEVAKGRLDAVLTSASQTFLREEVPAPGKLFDAVRDFGAKGDGETDDTAAIEKCIDAARMHGAGAVAYLPGGQYRFSRTLQITGGHYTVGGTGHRSVLRWTGPPDGEMVRVRQPQGVSLEYLSLEGPLTATRIHQTGETGASDISYDDLYTNSHNLESMETKGLWCDRLPKGAVVRIGHLNGNVRLTDCGPATILGAIHYFRLVLDGASQPKTGIAGFMFHNDAGHLYALDVLDNQNVVVNDLYSESNRRFLLCAGRDGQPEGHVSIGASKMSPTEEECIMIDNYRGRVFLGGGAGWSQNHLERPLSIVQKGARPVDLIIAGQGWWSVEPNYTFGPGARFASVENLLVANNYPEYNQKSLPLRTTPATEAALIASFDDFRQLAAAYLKVFYAAR